MTNGEKIKELFPSFDVEDKTEYFGRVRNLDDHFIKADIDWWNAEYKEPSTKNDLGVDCISRPKVLRLMKDNWHTHNGDWAMQESMDDIRALPSVTPQEPRWISVSERLPDTDNEVLCWYEYYHWSQEKVLPEYGIGCYLRETSSWFGEVANGHKVRVLAWMPLPKPYEPTGK